MENEQKLVPFRLGNLPSRNMTLVERQTLESRIKALEKQLDVADEHRKYWMKSADFWKVRAQAYKQLLELYDILVPLEVLKSFPKSEPCPFEKI